MSNKNSSFVFLILVLVSCQVERQQLSTEPIQPPSPTEPKPYKIIEDFWEPVANNPGEYINGLATDSRGYLYAGNSNGFHRSMDYGQSWDSLHYSRPSVIYITPRSDLILIGSIGLFTTITEYSSDDGRSWNIPFTRPNVSINQYISLNNGNLLTGGYVHDESAGGLWVSVDSSTTWQLSSIGFNNSVHSFSLNAKEEVYASVTLDAWSKIPRRIIASSTNSGLNWSEIANIDTLGRYGGPMVINGRNEFIVGTDSCLFISRDNCATWEPIGLGGQAVFVENITNIIGDNLLVLAYVDGYKVFYLPYESNDWYALEEISIYYSRQPLTVGRDGYIYIFSDLEGIFRSVRPVESILE